MKCRRFPKMILAALLIFVGFSAGAELFPQEKLPPGRKAGPVVNSPEVLPDRRVIFRIAAPGAETVTLQATDISGLPGDGPRFTKGSNGVWESTVGPLEPGAFRYTFMVDGVAVVDPVNPWVSESNNNVWSLVYVPGAEFMDEARVPHGAVAEVHYYSTVLERFRRMHVYTPPGFGMRRQNYPVLYLLHGAGDCDDSWSTVGRAGFILDNLIAAKKAVPMIVVMPAGHTSGGGMGPGFQASLEEFTQEFIRDIRPYIEKHYPVLTKCSDRAIAGLSMGGMQTLNISMAEPGDFGYVGVFSSGVFGMPAPGSAPKLESTDWEKQHGAALADAVMKKNLKFLWFATGAEDFLLNTTRSTVEMFRKHGFSPVYIESGGGHTWINWRNYLHEFVPRLFGAR